MEQCFLGGILHVSTKIKDRYENIYKKFARKPTTLVVG